MVKLKFGVISDVHCQYRGFSDHFEKALRYFRDCNVDAVMIVGDLADMGMYEELQFVADTWYRVFPNDKAPDGHHVEKLFMTGNHDVSGGGGSDWRQNTTWRGYYCDDFEEMEKHNLMTMEGGIAKAWEKCFHEKFEHIYRKQIKGFDFICANWDTWDGVDGIEEYFKSAAPTLDPNKPFFYAQHPHPKNTVYEGWAWGADDGRSTRALSAFPNAIVFSGHSHMSLTSETSIWQGSFTSVGTATLGTACADYGGREEKYGFPGEQCHDVLHGFTSEAGQGLLVSVLDDNTVIIDRRDITFGNQIGEPWVIDGPACGDKSKYSYDVHAAALGAPSFAPDATVTVEQGGDCVLCDAGHDQHLTVHFPIPAPKGALRAYDFEVALEVKHNNVVKAVKIKRTISPSAHMPQIMEATESQCLFLVSDLPAPPKSRWQQRKYRFRVTPFSSLGVAGAPIYSSWQEVVKE